MALWDLLTFASGAAAFGGVLAALSGAGLSGSDRIIAIVAGLLIALTCVSLIRVGGRRVFRYLTAVEKQNQGQAPRRHEIAGRLMYVLAAIWVFVCPLLSSQAITLVIRCCIL